MSIMSKCPNTGGRETSGFEDSFNIYSNNNKKITLRSEECCFCSGIFTYKICLTFSF